ncbi:MAG: outer membrane beta-barrel protein [Owenweeksia sp.]
MSDIDKKYKEEFGEQNFPESLKQKGWAAMEGRLDAEMPVSGGGSGAAGQLWMAARVLLLVAVLAVPAIWYFGFYESETPAKQVPATVATPAGEQGAGAANWRKINDATLTDETTKSTTEGNVEKPSKGNNTPENVSGVSSPLESKTTVSGNNSNLGMDKPQPADIAQNTPAFTKQKDQPVTEEKPQDVIPRKPSPLPGKELALIGNESTPEKKESTGNLPTENSKENTLDTETQAEPGLRPSENEKEILAGKEDTGEKSPDEKGETTVETEDEETASEEGTEEKTVDFKMAHLAFPNIAETNVMSSSEEDEQINFFSRERFSLSLWGGYAYTGKILEADNQNYLDKRKNEEEAIWSIPTGLNLDYFLSRNWTFGVGIRWAEYGENIQYNLNRRDTAIVDGRFNTIDNFTNVISVDSVRVIDGILQGHWDYTVVYDVEDTTAQDANGRSSWRYIEIPVTVGYRFGSGRVKPWVRGGVSFGVPVQTSFQYIQTGATFLLDESQNGQRVAPLQYNALLNLGVDCYLTRSFSIRLNGFGTMQLNSGLVQSGVRQRYYQLGLSLGAAYNF